MNKNNNLVIIIVSFALLILLAFATVPHDVLDATDVKDYTDTAKFFAGDYAARYRGSHSVLYGLLLSPYVNVTNSYLLIKLSSAFFLCLIILSIYYISKKNKKTLILFIASPVVWLMAPWISPLPLVALLIIWAYFFIKKFEIEEKTKYAVYSGLLWGISAAFWATALYISFFFLISFFYDKKLYKTFTFLIGIFIGFLPIMIIDYLLFNFPFYSLIKHMSSSLLFALQGGTYNQGYSSRIFDRIFVLLYIPFYSYLLFKKEYFRKNKKTIIFLILSLLFILTNPQNRLLIVIMPIIILLLGEIIDNDKFRIQIIIFVILSLLTITPYILQSNYNLGARYFSPAFLNIKNFELEKPLTLDIISDLKEIGKEYQGETILVIGANDDYRDMAHFYWGKDIKEFVSIEDYSLYIQNKTTIASRKIISHSNIPSRREIWFEIGIDKSSASESDYSKIKYAISLNDNSIEGFELVKRYKKLYLFEKIS